MLGLLLVWTGYMFFTGGRTYSQFDPRANASSKIIQNMFIASGFSGLCGYLLKTILYCRWNEARAKYDCLTLANSIMVGMVAIAGVVDHVENWGAVIIGCLAAVFYMGGVLFLEFYRIDDPLEVFPVHACGGIWGLFATGFFDKYQGALFQQGIKQGDFMAYQIVGIVVIVAWVSLLSLPAFLVMRKLHLLRCDKAVEEVGFDVAELGDISEEFLDAVRDKLDQRDKETQKLDECECLKQVEGDDEGWGLIFKQQ